MTETVSAKIRTYNTSNISGDDSHNHQWLGRSKNTGFSRISNYFLSGPGTYNQLHSIDFSSFHLSVKRELYLNLHTIPFQLPHISATSPQANSLNQPRMTHFQSPLKTFSPPDYVT
ncbi:hypothetical protein B6U74_03855 [Candidatus Bathyarchaeota archaeon ex4484_205]|nr:MAG: hypothetical protein B6U74_03855 [Candidatus Bathyarchaeota archaeon ex4484_205]